jgi:hypothetical protein
MSVVYGYMYTHHDCSTCQQLPSSTAFITVVVVCMLRKAGQYSTIES